MPLLFNQSTLDLIKAIVVEHRWLIRLATAAFGLRLVYSKITKPPASLCHIPQAGFFAVLIAIAKQKPIDQIARQVTLPAAAKGGSHGFYVRFDNLGWTVHVTRPEAVKKILMTNDLFPKSSTSIHTRRGTLAGRLLLGPNILFLAGEQWKEQRKVINPAFHRSMPIQLFGRLSQKMLDVMEQETGPVDIHAMSQRWALDVLGESAFGFQFHALDDRDTNEWVTRYNCVVESAQKPFYFMFPSIERRFKTWIPERNKAHGELSIFLNMMSSIAEKKRQALVESSSSGPNSSGSKLAANDQEKDLLTLMIEAEQEGQGRLSDEELQSNLSVFFLAGHETTAAAIAFAIYHLAVNSDIQQRAREEVTRIFGDGYDILPTVEQTRELDYLNRVIKETLRMEPPAVSMVPRIATQDTELSGVFIPKGTRLTVDLYELHHNPEVWKDPDQFDPDRFAPGGESDVMADGMPWAPFSNGSRQCIGMNFSLMEQRVLLPMLLMKYEWRLPENSIHKEKVITNGLGVIKPIDLKVIFTKRY